MLYILVLHIHTVGEFNFFHFAAIPLCEGGSKGEIANSFKPIEDAKMETQERESIQAKIDFMVSQREKGLSKLSDDTILDCVIRWHNSDHRHGNSDGLNNPLFSTRANSQTENTGDTQGATSSALKSREVSSVSSEKTGSRSDTSSSTGVTSILVPATQDQIKYMTKYKIPFTKNYTSKKEAWTKIKAHKEGRQ